MDKYKEHEYGQLSREVLLELEHQYDQVAYNVSPFYGYVHYQLGYMYFSGNGTEVNYEKAWHHFNISHEVFNTKEALRFMTIETEEEEYLETATYLKKIEMFNAVVAILILNNRISWRM
jgi:hypothetical protein